MNVYESEKLLGEYLLFHYGTAEEILPGGAGPVSALDFAVRIVHGCFDTAAFPSGARALDLGCAVGRSSFELARFCSSVVGIDFSASFIRAAEGLRQGGRLSYFRTDEGARRTALTALRPGGMDPERLGFETGDAMNLRPGLGSFDAVLLANLVDRLTDPLRCLQQLPALVKPGGQLVITSPYTWLEEFTPRENWLGAATPDSPSTLDALTRILSPDFQQVAVRDVPFLIREHSRKFQWSVAQASRWIRRA